jgi:hypothetical protein
MTRIAMVGETGAGGTTVLGLLYTALVRRSSAEGSVFRFHVAPESLQRVGTLFEQLRAGEFPAPGVGAIEILFEAPDNAVASLRARLQPRRHPSASARPIAWTRATFSDVRDHLASGRVPTDGARQLEGADVVLVLVPTAASDGPDAAAAPARDDTLARLLKDLEGGNRTGAKPPTAVAFMFTMLDRLPEARRPELGLPSPLEDPISPAHRDGIGHRLLQESMPKTQALIRAAGSPDRSGVPRPRFFFSWVETEPAAAGRLRLRPSPGGGWEPAYPFKEYNALIEACGIWTGSRP